MSRDTARDVAARVVERVMFGDAYLAAVLSAELETSDLEPRDRALATELSYGVLRTAPFLTARLQLHMKKKPDTKVLIRLLLASYELFFLDRVPAHASVSEAVLAVRRLRGEAQAGFSNAVLRRVAEAGPGATLSEATVQSVPTWLRKRLTTSVGAAAAEALAGGGPVPSPCLRLRKDKEAPAWFDAETEALAACPGVFRYQGGGDPRKKQGFADGVFVVQELGAQLVAWSVGALPGEKVLDVCAGRGNKSMLLAELVGPTGKVVATDLHESKLRLVTEQARAFGLEAEIEARVWDWTQAPPDEWLGQFDAVLVDAPCTGVGTLRRRPEIAARLKEGDPARMGELQAKILENARLAVKPGGRLVFATCSVLPEEGEAVLARVARWLGPGPSLGGTLSAGLPFRGEPVFRVTPELLDADGYFLASLALA